jgi:hypothetical protein
MPFYVMLRAVDGGEDERKRGRSRLSESENHSRVKMINHIRDVAAVWENVCVCVSLL